MPKNIAPPSQAIRARWRTIIRIVPKRNASPGSTDATHSNAIDTTSRATRKAESCEFFVTLGSQANAAMGRLSAALVLFGGAIASAAARPEARSARAGRASPAGEEGGERDGRRGRRGRSFASTLERSGGSLAHRSRPPEPLVAGAIRQRTAGRSCRRRVRAVPRTRPRNATLFRPR